MDKGNETEQYGRIEVRVPADAARVVVQAPDGSTETVPSFVQQDFEFQYDFHGYESQIPKGGPYRCIRYTPELAGTYTVRDEDGGQIESFVSRTSSRKGYVRVSPKDPRYFAFSTGESYVPAGLNLVTCPYDKQPAGTEHFVTSGVVRTMGLFYWKRWLRKMHESGVTYMRLWLSSAYFDARTQVMGVHDLSAFARLDAVVELARQYDIRIKMCLEHFRTFTDSSSFAYKQIIDPDTGRPMRDIRAWVAEEKWNRRWLADIAPYLARYRNDPAVFAWELWNEMNCIDAPFPEVVSFTRRMIPEIRKRSPKNLVVNSTGSMDAPENEEIVKTLCALPEMDFLQVHRYLDQGAPYPICREDPVAFSLDAVRRVGTGKKPLLFTETGAVNDRHVGPFRFYPMDHKGLIFDDVTYPAFFAGAAAPGHIWHWEQYVDPQDLWSHYQPIVGLLSGVAADEEGFEPFEVPHEKAWILGLKGKNTTLLMIRSRYDRWDHVLRDGNDPPVLDRIPLPVEGRDPACYSYAADSPVLQRDEHGYAVTGLRRGILIRLET